VPVGVQPINAEVGLIVSPAVLEDAEQPKMQASTLSRLPPARCRCTAAAADNVDKTTPNMVPCSQISYEFLVCGGVFASLHRRLFEYFISVTADSYSGFQAPV
jgi:hypothetical protein